MVFRGMGKLPQVAALIGLSRPEMEMAIQNPVKHLPKMTLGLDNFRTWSKERHL